jgi:hypothetical protein
MQKETRRWVVNGGLFFRTLTKLEAGSMGLS